MVNACTIIARNYLPYARVLARSFLSHHPGGYFTVLLIDDEDRTFEDRLEPFSCQRLSDIGLSSKEISQLAAIYDVTELATAVKPQFLRKLLSEGRDHILYLDPDIKVFDSLEPAALLARQHGIVLTPHMTSPLPKDGRRVNDAHILSSGIYNLGFIALGENTGPFIDWWWSRTRRDALIDQSHMMFTDQRWIDYVPSFFEHHLLKHPGYNVAYWNLHERQLAWTGEHYLVSGQPLAFFHFSGFNTEVPYLLSKHQGDRPRILLSDRPAVRRICEEYQADLLREGGKEPAPRYGWTSLPSGMTFDRRMRRLYHAGLEAFERGEAPEPPAPFECEDDFIAWLNEPVAAGPRPRVSRYLYSVYCDRPDLQSAFPNLAGVDASRYFLWLPDDGVTQEKIPPALLPPFDAHWSGTHEGFADPSELQEGVNIVGYFSAELGIGEAARLLRGAVECAGTPFSTLDYCITESRRSHPYVARGDGRAPYDVNVICVNGDRTPDFATSVGPEFFAGRYNVGFWFWELEQFSAAMHAGFDAVDEVWAASRFIADAVGRIGRRPVHHIPLAVPVPICAAGVTRESLKLPPGFLFLFIFDFFSTIERKNPLGVIEAFREAFRDGEGPTLVLKTINGHRCLTDLERVRAAAGDRSDILVIDESYPAGKKNALLQLCDCYVSLHRSEGFGLTIAEAMSLQRPVIATAYSGTLDFTTPANSYLVDYGMTRVSSTGGPYPAGSLWANPRISHAAALMRRAYEAPREAEAKAVVARQDILTRHSLEASAAAVTQRLDAIRRSRRQVTINRQVHGPDSASSAAPQGRIGGLAQRTLFRMLNPYWRFKQRQAYLLEGLRDAKATAARAAAVGPHQQTALAAVWTVLHRFEAKQLQERAELDAARRARTKVRRRLRSLESQLVSIEASVRALAFARDTTSRRDHVDHEHHLVANTIEPLENGHGAPSSMVTPVRLQLANGHGHKPVGFLTGAAPPANGHRGAHDVPRKTAPTIRARQDGYLPLLRGCGPVTAIGSGRGELLDLLRDSGVPIVGINLADALAYLRGQPDASIGALFAAHVVEHFTSDDLTEFLQLSRAKLKPGGGRLIFETVNPHAVDAFKASAADIAPLQPIFPEAALTWCRLSGFERVDVIFPHGSGDPEQDRRTQGDYVVVAVR